MVRYHQPIEMPGSPLGFFTTKLFTASAKLAVSMERLNAANDALAGRVQAVVTAPVNKEAFAAAGFAWRGHTELLAHIAHTPNVAMMFVGGGLRVVLVQLTHFAPRAANLGTSAA